MYFKLFSTARSPEIQTRIFSSFSSTPSEYSQLAQVLVPASKRPMHSDSIYRHHMCLAPASRNKKDRCMYTGDIVSVTFHQIQFAPPPRFSAERDTWVDPSPRMQRRRHLLSLLVRACTDLVDAPTIHIPARTCPNVPSRQNPHRMYRYESFLVRTVWRSSPTVLLVLVALLFFFQECKHLLLPSLRLLLLHEHPHARASADLLFLWVLSSRLVDAFLDDGLRHLHRELPLCEVHLLSNQMRLKDETKRTRATRRNEGKEDARQTVKGGYIPFF